MTVFIITVNEQASSLGFDSLEKAQNWILNRRDKPAMVYLMRFESHINTYLIKDIDIK